LKIAKNIKKTLGAENSKFKGKFGVSKFIEPASSGDRQIQKFVLIDFDI